jgi:hypothetical protein
MPFSFPCFSEILIAREKHREKENITKCPIAKEPYRSLQIIESLYPLAMI